MPSALNPKSKTPQLCVSLLPKNQQELKAQLMAPSAADLIEIRLDWFPKFTGAKKMFDSDLMALYRDKPLILAVRTKDEGGFFSGDSSEIIKVYQSAQRLFRRDGQANAVLDYLDISYSIANPILLQLQQNKGMRIILSSHTKERDIDLLRKELKQMSETEADVYKLVFTANALSDNITVLKLIDFAKELNIPFIIHAQGEAGKLSRIIGSFKGNLWTYVSLSENQKTAAGQLSLHAAKHQYFLQEKNSCTKIIGLIGYPVAQSKGWLLFNRIFHFGGDENSPNLSPSNCIYLNFPTKNIAGFCGMWHHWVDGLSVTIPHKENILKYADFQSEEVQQSGVCNTLIKRDNLWYAHNTDLLAMVKLMEPYAARLIKKAVLLYGTGATTRSAIAALRRVGVQNILVMGRNKIRGRMLGDQFSIKFVEANESLPNLSAIIQTTPVGMHPNVDQIPECIEYLKNGMIAFDVVFNPPLTKFMQAAKEKACITISGEEMYLHQAALQFALFTGRAISINDLTRIWNEL